MACSRWSRVGLGKTRTAVEAVREFIDSKQVIAPRIALIGRTAADVRDVLINGPSGLLSIYSPADRPLYEPSKRQVTYRNGAIIKCFSAEEPDSLRGPQFHFAVCDELAAWQKLIESWDNLQMGLRLRDGNWQPRCIITTTPRPLQFLIDLIERDSTITTSGSTYDNADNLAASYIEDVEAKYAGTSYGQQELEGKILTEAKGALWKRENIDENRKKVCPDLHQIVVAVDPATSATGDETGIVVCGKDSEGTGYVLADRSIKASPDQWARVAVDAYHEFEANVIVAEKNQGGEMVRLTLQTVDENVPIKLVTASKGKRIRAEPIAAKYEQNRVHHVGLHEKLENQMCSWDPYIDKYSPDRVDALVWGLTELMIDDGWGNISISPSSAGKRPSYFKDL